MHYPIVNAATTGTTTNCSHFMEIVRTSRARFHDVAMLHRQSLNLCHRARAVACKLGLALDTGKARACDQRMVSVLPLPILVDSPSTPALSISSSPSSSRSSSSGPSTPSISPLNLTILPPTANQSGSASLLSPLELETVMLSPATEKSTYTEWCASLLSNQHGDLGCVVAPNRISSCKRKPSVSLIPRSDAHLIGKRVKFAASCD